MKHGFKKSLTANFIGLLVTFADRLVVVPVLFAFLSESVAAFYIVLRTIPAYLVSADLGLSSEMGNRIARVDPSASEEERKNLYSTVLFVVTGIGVFVLLASNFFIYLKFDEVFKSVELKSADLYVITFTVLLYAVSMNQSQMSNAVLRGVGFDYRGLIVTHLVRMAEIVSFIVLLILYSNLLYASCGYLFMRLAGNWFLGRERIANAPWAKPDISKFRFKVLFSMIQPALGFAALPLGLAITQQAPIMFIASINGVALAATYALFQTLSRFSGQICLQVNRSLWPVYSKISGRQADFWRVHDLSVAFIFYFSICVAAALCIFGDLIIEIWTVSKVGMIWPLFLPLVFAGALNATWYSLLTADLSVSTHAKTVGFYVCSTTVILLVSYLISVNIFGSDVPVLLSRAVLFSELLMLVYMLIRVARKREMNLMKLVYRIFYDSNPILLVLRKCRA